MKNRSIVRQNRRAMDDNIIKPLKKAGLHPIDVCYGDGYFIFEYGKNTVLHFSIKELPDFRFGVWKDYYGKNTLTIFGDSILYLDKFKPTRHKNFNDIYEIIDFVKKYQSGKYSLRYVFDTIFENGGYEWEEKQTDEEFYKEYYSDLAEQKYADEHFGFNKEEYEKYIRDLNNVIDILKNTKFVCDVYLYCQPWHKNPYSVEFTVNKFINELSQTEQFKWRTNLRNMCDDNGIEFDFKRLYNLTKKEFIDLVRHQKKSEWIKK